MDKTQTQVKKFDLFIGGHFQKPTQEEYIESINPSSGEILAKIAKAGKDDVDQAVRAARQAFDEGPWTHLEIKERGRYLGEIAKCIRDNAKVLADLESSDTGKTSKQTTFIDVPTCADTFEYFSKVEKPLEDQALAIAAPVDSKLLREPIGVVAGIIPWNYPLIMFGWKVAPALLAGNTVVFKPSIMASVSIMKLMELLQGIKLPDGVLNIITGSGRGSGNALISHPDIDMINFTGGTETGKEVMQMASKGLKKVCLELGGKSPNIVFSDCDLEAAVGGTMSAIFMNQGQMCVAGSRLLLEDKIYDEFLKLLIERTKKLKIGNSAQYDTDFGPLVSDEQRKTVLGFIEKGKEEGAKLLCGGKIPESSELANGFYVEPTIFGEVNNSMTIAQEEIFGPVLCVIKFSSEQEAVKIANNTKFGLASMIWTKDLEKANRVSRKLRCGTVWINTYGGFYNEAPFGGYKQSGIGRELGEEGLLEHTQVKHVCKDATPGGMPLAASWF